MKYRLLSKEQFEELHKEFSTYLASQGIDKEMWEQTKVEKPAKVIGHLEKFSDIVWEDVLNRTSYLEHYSKDSLNLFHCKETNIERIAVQVEKADINLQEKAGFDWFMDNSNDASIHYFKGEKDYVTNRNEELFSLVEQGAILANNKLFEAIKALIKPMR